MPQNAAKKGHAKGNVVAVHLLVADAGANLLSKCGREDLVSIEQEYPVIRERNIVHRPLSLLWPTPLIVKLDHLGAERPRDFGSCVCTAGVDDADLADLAQGFQAARKVLLLVACCHDHADRQRGTQCPVL
ncbi:MAG TPA: hypothetical protein VFE61_11740 [Candidatus Sulfotelmatobacter sp.]|nr:hypothetical protein [Candidatus Sulfotelmatobacter sp.]